MLGVRGRSRAAAHGDRHEVKLLLDQNLSHRLCDRLADLGIPVVHARSVVLEAADDARIWAHAAEHEFMIVSKDSDFNNRAFLFGPSPKVVWIQRGNCPTQDIEDLLRARHQDLVTFAADAAAALRATYSDRAQPYGLDFVRLSAA